MATYFIALEHQPSAGVVNKLSAVIVGCTIDPDDKDFLKTIIKKCAEAHGWPEHLTLITSMSLLKQ